VNPHSQTLARQPTLQHNHARYDGDGRRVEKSNGRLYWYGTGTDPLDETDLSGNTNNASFYEYIFFDNNRIARRDYSNNVDYYFADHLSTARTVTNAAGTILDDSDFYPFGGERSVVGPTSGNTYKFTGKEKDSESALDNLNERYNASSMGRFMSPDPANIGAKLNAPQSWNAYSYVLNNPLKYSDPTGLDCIYLNEAGNGVDHIRPGDCESDSDNGYFVDSKQGTVTKSDVTFSNDGNVAVVSFQSDTQPGTQYNQICTGDCSAYTVTVNAGPTIGPDTSPLTPFQQSLVPLPEKPLTTLELRQMQVCMAFGGAENVGSIDTPQDFSHPTEAVETKTKATYVKVKEEGKPLRPGPTPQGNRKGAQNGQTIKSAVSGLGLLGDVSQCINSIRP